MTNKKVKMGFLGPSGSFSEEAAENVLADEYVPFSTIPKLFKAFWNGEIDKVIIPIENSIEGTVVPAIDSLINGNGNPFVIEGEIKLPIKQNLIGIGELSEVKTVISHPQALAQCANFIEELEIRTEGSNSTSAAVKQIAEKQDRSIAAIGTKRAAEMYCLRVIKENIQDSDNNITRFILLGHNTQGQTVSDKISLIFEIENKPGKLLRVLEVFDALDINMTNIVSRPSKIELGKYIFWVDIDGHQLNEKVKVALGQVEKRTNFLKILGSYPKTEV